MPMCKLVVFFLIVSPMMPSSSMVQITVSRQMSVMMSDIGLHLKHQITSLHRHILWVENARVLHKASACFVPSVCIESVKIVTPVQVELIVSLIVGEDLNVVVHEIPGHIGSIQTLSPDMELRGPEVHPEGLLLTHALDYLAIVDMPDFVAVNRPTDVVWGPLEDVCVPLIAWIKPMNVLMGLSFAIAIALKDYVSGKRVVGNTGDYLNI